MPPAWAWLVDMKKDAVVRDIIQADAQEAKADEQALLEQWTNNVRAIFTSLADPTGDCAAVANVIEELNSALLSAPPNTLVRLKTE
eukprot:13109156-Alexandrium_andersonii.AAC.1